MLESAKIRLSELPQLDPARTILYSTAPPISVHRTAAALAKQYSSLRWVAEYRDPWIEPGRGGVFWSGTMMAPSARHLLHRLIRGADLHVAVSHGIGRWLTRHGAGRVVESLNGIPDELLDQAVTEVDTSVARYLGEFYLGRDPRPLAATLGRLRVAGLLPEGFRLELIGDVGSVLGIPTAELFSQEGLADLVELHGRLPHNEALERTRRAGLLLLLAQRQPDQIPNKLYEYLGARRPILAVVDKHGESHRLLQRAGADQFVLTEASSENDWDRVVLGAVEASSETRYDSPTGLEDLRSSRQLAEVVRDCEDLLD